MKQKYVCIIFGPTAVGKTEWAETIAQSIPAEIINMDVGQFYTPLSIGTAKPDWKHSPIVHHLFDIIDEPKSITVIQYRALVEKTVHAIWKKGKLPILVGGSGFYLKSLFFPPRACVFDENLTQQYAGHINIWHELKKIDPVRAQHINKNDTYRIVRALGIWHATGQLPSTYVPEYDPFAPFCLLYLTRERQELYTRINDRVIKMIDKGWIEEIKTVCHDLKWREFLQEKKIIGYNDIIQYLSTAHTEQELVYVISVIQKKTRNYAKRQHTFWKMLEKELKNAMFKGSEKDGIIDTVTVSQVDIHNYISSLVKKISIRF